MKFRQLIEYNMRDIFLEKSYRKCGGEDSLIHLWINSLQFYTVCFYCIPSWGLSTYIESNLQTTCIYLILSIFEK